MKKVFKLEGLNCAHCAAKIEEKKNDKKLPSTGQSISIATMVGGVLLTLFGFGYNIKKRRNH